MHIEHKVWLLHFEPIRTFNQFSMNCLLISNSINNFLLLLKFFFSSHLNWCWICHWDYLRCYSWCCWQSLNLLMPFVNTNWSLLSAHSLNTHARTPSALHAIARETDMRISVWDKNKTIPNGIKMNLNDHVTAQMDRFMVGGLTLTFSV